VGESNKEIREMRPHKNMEGANRQKKTTARANCFKASRGGNGKKKASTHRKGDKRKHLTNEERRNKKGIREGCASKRRHFVERPPHDQKNENLPRRSLRIKKKKKEKKRESNQTKLWRSRAGSLNGPGKKTCNQKK